MRQLQFVGVSDDGAHLLLQDAANVREQFMLPVDDRLRAASRGDRSRLGQIELELDSTLRPREIQARIRAGESPEEVAAAAGAPLQRVMRFAYPVLQEREQVTVEARRTRIRRSDGALQLGEQVDDRLTRQGIDPETADWDACRREDGTWWLSLSWMAGKTPRRAQWSFDLAGRTLTPADDLAAELQAEQPRRRQISAVPFVPDDDPTDDQSDSPDETAEEPAAAPSRSRTVVEQPVRPAARAQTEPRNHAEPRNRPEPPARSPQPEQPGRSEQQGRTEQHGKHDRRNESKADRRDGAVRRGREQRGTVRPARPDDQPVDRGRSQQAPRPRSEPYGWAAPTVPAEKARPAADATTEVPRTPAEQTPEARPTRGRAPEPAVETESAAVETAADSNSAAVESPTQQNEPEAAPAKPGKGRKPKVPSWDDIVFGTRGHR